MAVEKSYNYAQLCVYALLNIANFELLVVLNAQNFPISVLPIVLLIFPALLVKIYSSTKTVSQFEVRYCWSTDRF